MTDIQFLGISIACKSTLLLAIVSLVMFVGARRSPGICMVWQRVGILGLLIVPFAVCVIPTIDIPVLPSKYSDDLAEAAVISPKTSSRSTSIPSPAVEFAGESSRFEREMTDAISATHMASIPVEYPTNAATPLEPVPVTTVQRSNLLSRIIFSYGLVLSVLLSRFVGALWGLKRLKRASSPVLDADWLNEMSDWIGTLGVNVPVELRVSDGISIPMTFGGCHPVLLIPRSCLSTCDQTQRTAVLIHELTHISRRDFQWQILTHIAASLYWFHPFAWYVRREAAVLQERLCDLTCSQHLGSANYGKTLVEIAFRSLRRPIAELGIAMASSSSLKRRLNDLKSSPTANTQPRGRMEQALVVGVATVVLGVVIFGMLTARISKTPPASRATIDSSAEVASTALENTVSRQTTNENADVGLVTFLEPNRFPEFISLGRDRNLGGNNAGFEIRQVDLVTFAVSKNDSETSEQEDKTDWPDDSAAFNAQVAATVNGEPLLNDVILNRFSRYLADVRKQMMNRSNDAKSRHRQQSKPPVEEFGALREAIIQREIAVYIQRVLLVQYLKTNATPEELARLDKQLDEQFEREIEKLKRELYVSNDRDLDAELNKKGTSLQKVKNNFTLVRLAGECVGLKADPIVPVEESEIQEYYRQNHDQYAQSMGEVREDIRERLHSERRRNCIREFYKKVFSSAVIETQYSLPKNMVDQ